ncbi:NUDIX hydrolase [Methylococcus sp. EFPC2]|nr:NUDIX hydrolase [Methylococcus sp. EFPC2]
MYSVKSFDADRGNGATNRFNVLKCPDWVNVLAIVPSGQFVFVRQFRYALARETLELPGGIVEDGASPLESAQEELLEETGYAGGEWFILGNYLANAGLQNNYVHSFFCRNPSPKLGVVPEDGTTVQLLSTEEVRQALYGGELCQAFALASVLLASRQGLVTMS